VALSHALLPPPHQSWGSCLHSGWGAQYASPGDLREAESPLPALTPPNTQLPVNSPHWTEAQPLLPCDWQEASRLLREGEQDSGVSRLEAGEGGQASSTRPENPPCRTGAVASWGQHLPFPCSWPPSPPTSSWALPASDAPGGFQGNARGWVIIHPE